ncbi:MAG: hypothetical protein JXR36_15580 [Bacteroidales bacterium]|nr:hypothetical protein [Bacteroidales bacterium]
MKKIVYIFVFENYIYFGSDKLSAEVSFEQQTVKVISDTLIAALISDKLKELGLVGFEKVLILNESFYEVKSKLESFVKRDVNEQKINVKKTKHYSQSNKIVSEHSSFLYKGNIIESFSALPLLEKYYIKHMSLHIASSRMEELTEALNDRDVFPDYFIPFTEYLAFYSHICQENTLSDTVMISIQKEKTLFFNYLGGFLNDFGYLSQGYTKLISDVGNNFNVSPKIASKLIDLYGFVFLPKKYLNFVIDVPVYHDIVISIELTDLAYCIRESLREILSDLLVQNTVNKQVNLVLFAGKTVRGLDKLAGLMLNVDPIEFSISTLQFSMIEKSFHLMLEFEKSLQVKENRCNEELVKESFSEKLGIKSKITDIFTQLKPWLLETDS